MDFYKNAIKTYEKELNDRIINNKNLTQAKQKKTVTLEYERHRSIDKVPSARLANASRELKLNKKINKAYNQELKDRIINENQLQEALNQKYGIMDNGIMDTSQLNNYPIDSRKLHNEQDEYYYERMKHNYIANSKYQHLQERVDNIEKFRDLLSEVEPRQGVISEVIKNLKDYEIEEVVKHRKKYIELIKHKLNHFPIHEVMPENYIQVIRGHIPNNVKTDDLLNFDDIPQEDLINYEELPELDEEEPKEKEEEEPKEEEEEPKEKEEEQKEEQKEEEQSQLYVTLMKKTKSQLRELILYINGKEGTNMGISAKKKADYVKRLESHFKTIESYNLFMEYGISPKKGQGLRRKKIIKGRGNNVKISKPAFGLKPQQIPNIVALGRSFLRLKQLYYDNILSLKYTKNLIAYQGFPPVRVGNELKKIILSLIDDIKPSIEQINKLSKKEQATYLVVISLCGLNDISVNRKEIITQLHNELNILHGEIYAGNDNPEILSEIKKIAHQLHYVKAITHKELLAIKQSI